jgi:hypothetical protein
MDPDAIFIILLYITMFVLTIGSIIGLSKKIWQADISVILKLLVVGLLVGLLIFALAIFDGVETGDVIISRWDIMIYSASLLIGLNWSINLSRKPVLQTIEVPKYLKVTVMTIVFATLIPTMFHLIGNFFDKLNLMGSGG